MWKKTNLFIAVILSGCSSAPKPVADYDHIGEEKVIETYGKADELKHALPFSLEGHRYVAVGFVTIPGDHRPEAGVSIATARARQLIGKIISTRLESFLQSSSEGTSGETQGLREVITEVSKVDASEWSVGPNYYEKVKVISESGTPRLEYRLWSSVSLDESTFKAHVLDAIRTRQGRDKATEAFQRSVDNNWNSIVGNNTKAEEHTSITTKSQDAE